MDNTQFRAALRRLGLRQNAFARRLGVTPTTVNKWAKGTETGGPPVPEYAVALLAALTQIEGLQQSVHMLVADRDRLIRQLAEAEGRGLKKSKDKVP